MATSVPTTLPERFGHYRVLKQLGAGGMGSVYLAEDTRLNRKVALKVAHLSAERAVEQKERFLREAQAAAALQHPNLCPVYDFGDIAGVYYLVMAYIEGPTLAEWHADARPRPFKEAAALVGKLALAMAEAHKAGIIHRDLKPANIKLNSRGEPVILDFGLARRTGTQDSRLTQSGAIIGTPSYMAPEQVLGDKQAIGPATDIYALGVILYELLAGRLPFEAQEMTAILVKIAHDLPSPPSEYRAELDPRLETICLKALAKKPEERFAGMKDLARELLAFVRGELPSAAGAPRSSAASKARVSTVPKSAPPAAETWSGIDREKPRPRRKRAALGKGWLAAIGLLGLLLLLVPMAVIGFLIARNRPGPPAKDGTEKPPPLAEGKELVNSIGMRLALIPASKFWMGSPPDEAGRSFDEEQHEVEISRPFYLGVFEVTQGEYQRVMNANPSWFSLTGGDRDRLKREGAQDTDRLPAELVSWHDAKEFCRRLSELPEEKRAGRVYRLPTEAEWEYACRGGASTRAGTPYHFGPTLTNKQANFSRGPGKTTPGGTYPANPFGLHDLHGNVWEWCEDWYGPYDTRSARDPQGPATGSFRVLRGGSWYDTEMKNSRSAARFRFDPTNRFHDLGFRVVCLASGPRPS